MLGLSLVPPFVPLCGSCSNLFAQKVFQMHARPGLGGLDMQIRYVRAGTGGSGCLLPDTGPEKVPATLTSSCSSRRRSRRRRGPSSRPCKGWSRQWPACVVRNESEFEFKGGAGEAGKQDAQKSGLRAARAYLEHSNALLLGHV